MAIAWARQADSPVHFFGSTWAGVVDNKLTVVGGLSIPTGVGQNQVWQTSDGVTWTQVQAKSLVNGRHYGDGFFKFNKIFVAGGSSNPGTVAKAENVQKGNIISGGFRFQKAGKLNTSDWTLTGRKRELHYGLFAPVGERRAIFLHYNEEFRGILYYKDDMMKGGSAYQSMESQILYTGGAAWKSPGHPAGDVIVTGQPTGSFLPTDDYIIGTPDGYMANEITKGLPLNASWVQTRATFVWNGRYYLLSGNWGTGAPDAPRRVFYTDSTFQSWTEDTSLPTDVYVGGQHYSMPRAVLWNGDVWVIGLPSTHASYKVVYKGVIS